MKKSSVILLIRFDSADDYMDDLLTRLNQDVMSSLKTIKITDIDDSMVEAIYESVYDPYPFDPTIKDPYHRRYERKGLSDKRNFELFPSESIGLNSVEVVIRNMTQGNNDYRSSVQDWSGSYTFEIDRIIVNGQGYSWQNSRFYNGTKPRDFYKATRIKVEKYLKQRIEEELKAKGW